VSERPERIEREMFEIRSRMAPDMVDLRRHVDPKAVGERVKQTARQRLQAAVAQARLRLKTKQEEFVGSARRQLKLVGEAGKKGDPAAIRDAVKSDPRPLVLLAVVLAATLMVVWRASRGESG
jgi:hypothetical protein